MNAVKIDLSKNKESDQWIANSNCVKDFPLESESLEELIERSRYKVMTGFDKNGGLISFNAQWSEWINSSEIEQEKAIKENSNDDKWESTSDNAKSVIEWVECPRSGNFNNVEIEIGKEFRPRSDVNVYIFKDLFAEIYKFVSEDNNLKIVERTDNKLIFCFTDEYKNKWRRP